MAKDPHIIEYWDAVEMMATIIAKFAADAPTLEQLAVPSFFDAYLKSRPHRDYWHDVSTEVFGTNWDPAPNMFKTRIKGKTQKIPLQPSYNYSALYELSLKIQRKMPITLPEDVLDAIIEHSDYKYKKLSCKDWYPNDENTTFHKKKYILFFRYDNPSNLSSVLTKENLKSFTVFGFLMFNQFGKCKVKRSLWDSKDYFGTYLLDDEGSILKLNLSEKNGTSKDIYIEVKKSTQYLNTYNGHIYGDKYVMLAQVVLTQDLQFLHDVNDGVELTQIQLEDNLRFLDSEYLG